MTITYVTLPTDTVLSPFHYHPLASYRATIKFRRSDNLVVRPECEAADGLRLTFLPGWLISEEDNAILAGETAMIPVEWIEIGWIASGDLTNITMTL